MMLPKTGRWSLSKWACAPLACSLPVVIVCTNWQISRCTGSSAVFTAHVCTQVPFMQNMHVICSMSLSTELALLLLRHTISSNVRSISSPACWVKAVCCYDSIKLLLFQSKQLRMKVQYFAVKMWFIGQDPGLTEMWRQEWNMLLKEYELLSIEVLPVQRVKFGMLPLKIALFLSRVCQGITTSFSRFVETDSMAVTAPAYLLICLRMFAWKWVPN